MVLFYMFVLLVFFVTGLGCLSLGIMLLFTKEFREAAKKLSTSSVDILSAHSAVTGKALNDAALLPAMESASRLIDSISNLIRTSTGVGAFLCLLGFVIDIVSLYGLNTTK